MIEYIVLGVGSRCLHEQVGAGLDAFDFRLIEDARPYEGIADKNRHPSVVFAVIRIRVLLRLVSESFDGAKQFTL